VATLGGLAIGISYNLIGPDLAEGAYLYSWPVRVAGAVHAFRIAKRQAGAVPQSWFARWYALAGLYFAYFAIPMLTAAMLRALWVESFEVRSAAMAPALVDGDRVWANKRAYDSVSPAIGEIVVIRDDDGITYIRRVIARRDEMFVTRNEAPGGQPLTVLPRAIVAKVIAVYWSGATRRWRWEVPS
jgi:hypothetical protein